jgi:hypothetical protein
MTVVNGMASKLILAQTGSSIIYDDVSVLFPPTIDWVGDRVDSVCIGSANG